MNDEENFVRDFDDSLPSLRELTGWEVVVFELADEDDLAE